MTCVNEICSMKKEIDNKKIVLENILKTSFLSENTIKLSQELDNLLVKCLKCELSLKSLDISNLTNLNRKHAMFLYYDLNHISLNISLLVSNAIKNNEKVLLFIQPDWMEILRKNEIINDNVEYFPMDEVIKLYKDCGAMELEDYLREFNRQLCSKGFNGMFLIGQISYAIKLTEQKEFLDFESILTKIFKKINASILCLYDFYDYTKTRKVINQKVIKDSLYTHTNVKKV